MQFNSKDEHACVLGFNFPTGITTRCEHRQFFYVYIAKVKILIVTSPVKTGPINTQILLNF